MVAFGEQVECLGESTQFGVHRFRCDVQHTAVPNSWWVSTVMFLLQRDLQSETLGMDAECQMTRRFVTRSLPLSPEFPWSYKLAWWARRRQTLSNLCIFNAFESIYQNLSWPHLHLPVYQQLIFGPNLSLYYLLDNTFKSAKVTYASKMSNLTSRCSQMESTAATVIVSEVLVVVLVMGRTRRWLPYMHWAFNSMDKRGGR